MVSELSAVALNDASILRTCPASVVDWSKPFAIQNKRTLAAGLTAAQPNVILRHEQFAVGAGNQIADIQISVTRLRRRLNRVKDFKEIKIASRR